MTVHARHRFAALLLLFASTGCELTPTLPSYYRESYATLAGNRVRLADYPQKTLVLYFWTSDCESCASLSPLVRRIADHPSLKGSLVLGVNTDTDVKEERQRSQSESFRIPGDSLLDPDFQLVQALEIETAPAVAVLFDTGRSIQVMKFYDFGEEAEANIMKTIGKNTSR